MPVRSPERASIPAVDGRAPFVKICGITEPAGLDAAIAAGADAIGLNFVPGTPRALDDGEAAALVASARASGAPGNGPLLIGVFADRDPAEVAAIAARFDLDAVQLSGDEPPSDLDAIPLPVLKTLHIPAAGDPARSSDEMMEQAAAFEAKSNLQAILLDTSDPRRKGGTGRRASVEAARAIAERVPVVLAGGLTAANVGEALLDVPAIGVDTSSGVEPQPRPEGRPFKDPLAVALFVKRANAARLDLPTVPFGPRPVDPGLLEADAAGRWGTDRSFGGRFVPETLMAALLELEAAYEEHPPRPHVLGRAARAAQHLRRTPHAGLPCRPSGGRDRTPRRARGRWHPPLPQA